MPGSIRAQVESLPAGKVMSRAMLQRTQAVRRLAAWCPWIEDVEGAALGQLHEDPPRYGEQPMQQHRHRWGLRPQLRLERRLRELGAETAAPILNAWVREHGAPDSLDAAIEYLDSFSARHRTHHRRKKS